MTYVEQSSYRWSTAQAPHSYDYLATEVVAVIKRLGVSRVLDLGSGNDVLCGALAEAGVDSVVWSGTKTLTSHAWATLW